MPALLRHGSIIIAHPNQHMFPLKGKPVLIHRPFYRVLVLQLRQADTIYLNFTETLTGEKIHETISFIQRINPKAQIVSVPLSEITEDTFPERPDFPNNPEEPEKSEKTNAASDFFLSRKTSVKYQLKVKDADDRPAHILPRDPHKTTLCTWTWEVKEPFTEETLRNFWEDVKKEEI